MRVLHLISLSTDLATTYLVLQQGFILKLLNVIDNMCERAFCFPLFCKTYCVEFPKLSKSLLTIMFTQIEALVHLTRILTL